MKKILGLLLAVMLIASLLSACGGNGETGTTPTPTPSVESAPETDADTETEEPDDAPEAAGITVTDMTGREITLDEPASRVVALSPADCEILFALGAGDMLVGRGTYCDYPPEVLDIPVAESGANLNVEQVMMLEPQIILMTTMAQTVEQVEALENAGAKVVVSDAQNIEGVYTAIELIGALTGKTAEAEALVESMKNTFADIKNASSEDGTKTVYFEVSPLEYGLWTAGAGTFMDELASMVGLTNAFADVTGWGEISQEQVIERDPDYIVTIAMYWGDGPLPVDEIMARDGWGGMKAISNNNVFNADNNQIARPGPRLADAANALYDFIYG